MKVLIAGDYVPRNRLSPLIESGDFDTVFGSVKDIIKEADYALINFESPIVVEGDIPISKCGPNLKCSVKAVDAIKYAGFSCATLANNHIRDYGDIAVERTIVCLREQGIDYVGAGSNIKEAKKTLFRDLAGMRLAIINCCENEFSIASQTHYGANPLNVVNQYYSIQEARKNADKVLVVVHGGHEHNPIPSPRMQDTYRFFIDAGADVVVNHHQHCYSGYEIYKGRPIVYGTGNFCMDKIPTRKGQIWNYGYMVLWDTQYPDRIKVIPYDQCGEKPCVQLLPENAFDKELKFLNVLIGDRQKLEKETDMYYEKSIMNINNVLEPIQNKYIKYLQQKRWIPSLLSKQWLLKLQDYILCESHRDKMDYFFKTRKY